MALFTKSEFTSLAEARAGHRGVKAIVNESKLYSRVSQTISIFLSHSHTDKDVVEQAVAFFRTIGINIYVDWMDKTMPERTNGETASIIKTKIRDNDKFILLATNSAILSKWCNWEVGIGDTYKHLSNKLAILPLADNNKSWEGNEYLQIYPRIEYITNSFGIKESHVYYPNSTSETLINWLRK